MSARLETITFGLLFVLDPTDMKSWAKITKATWKVYDTYEREEEAIVERRYWEMMEEGWFSD
jgi:hypothetical protein